MYTFKHAIGHELLKKTRSIGDRITCINTYFCERKKTTTTELLTEATAVDLDDHGSFEFYTLQPMTRFHRYAEAVVSERSAQCRAAVTLQAVCKHDVIVFL